MKFALIAAALNNVFGVGTWATLKRYKTSIMDTVITLPPLFKRDSKGQVRVLYVEYAYKGGIAGTRTRSGLLDGKLVTSEWSLSKPKNVGKKNETTALEQAKSEAESIHKIKQEKSKYFTDINQIDTSTKFSPMLAHDFAKKPVSSGFSQPKLDGIRCIAKHDGLWTRAGKPITSCPHIWEAIGPFLESHPYMVLDGELYNHELKDDFNKITSLVRKTKPKPADIEECAKMVQYHVYDIFDNDYQEKTFSDRRVSLKHLVDDQVSSIVLVETDFADSLEEIDDLYGKYLGKGYEGQMIRQDTPYECKRSKSLLKRKEFITEEYRVVAVEEGDGNWSGAVKRFRLALEDGTEFGSGVRGTYGQMQGLLESGVTPDWATCRYFELTPDGIPRFPVVIDYGTGKRTD